MISKGVRLKRHGIKRVQRMLICFEKMDFCVFIEDLPRQILRCEMRLDVHIEETISMFILI